MSEGDWIPREWTDQHHSIQTEKRPLSIANVGIRGAGSVCSILVALEDMKKTQEWNQIHQLGEYIYSKYKHVCITIQYMHCRYTVSYPKNFRNKNIMLQTKTKILKKKFSHRCFFCLRGPSLANAIPSRIEIMNHPCPWKGWHWGDGPMGPLDSPDVFFFHHRFFPDFWSCTLKPSTGTREVPVANWRNLNPRESRSLGWLDGQSFRVFWIKKKLRLNTPYLNTPILHKWNAWKSKFYGWWS